VSVIKGIQMNFYHCHQVLHIDMAIYTYLLTYFAVLV